MYIDAVVLLRALYGLQFGS